MCVCVRVCYIMLLFIKMHLQNDISSGGHVTFWCYALSTLLFLCSFLRAQFCHYSLIPPFFSIFPDSKGDHNYRWRTMDDNASPEKLWFKAAVIAVPIAGGFILIFLVLLAVRMLRSDTKRHRRLMEMRKHRSLTKAQLYVADHFIDKSDSLVHTNALEKQNHIYKNVNIKIDCDGTIYEKQKNTDICDRPGSVSSVIVWGGDKNKDSEPSNV